MDVDTIHLQPVQTCTTVTTPLLENIMSQPAALQTVSDYQLGIGLRAIQRCAELVRNSKHVLLTGMGASLFACTPMRYALAARGVAVSVVETAELLYFLDGMLTPETVVVLVSRSGESIETIKVLDRLDGSYCRTIGVVNVPESTLARRTNEHIVLNSPPDQLVAVQTYIATAVALLLLAAAASGELDAAKGDIESTIRHLPGWVNATIAISENWQQFVELRSPLYILGRGSSLASVDEGVLLMHEVAKTPATGMSVAQFRHGFVEAADNNIRAVVMGTQAATAAIDHQFALDLIRMGAAVNWIGPRVAQSSMFSLGDWPDTVPSRFQCIFEAVPLQLLSYRTAESRGIVPGSFRWASTVTASESGFPGLNNRAGK